MLIKKFCVLILLVINLTGCAMHARLYPANKQASKTGILHATYINSGTGAGEITIVMPDGETLKGEYTTIDTSTYSFGTIYTSVYSNRGNAVGMGSASIQNIAGSSPGIASLYGNKGAQLHCEYFVNNFSSRGAGACRTEQGSLYRLFF